MEKVFVANVAMNPEGYLRAMLDCIDEKGNLSIARETLEDIAYTTAESIRSSTNIEKIKLEVDLVDYDAILDYYRLVLTAINNGEDEEALFDQHDIGKYGKRVRNYIKLIKECSKLNLLDIILQKEKRMLIDSIVLYKTKASDVENINKVVIDEDILKSLKGFYFKDYSDIYKAACYRAYLDFNRTLAFSRKPSTLSRHEQDEEIARRLDFKNRIVELFREKIADLRQKTVMNQDIFDMWHKEVCESIIQIYRGFEERDDDLFNYGQAQKWLNMTLKYLYCLGENFGENRLFLCLLNLWVFVKIIVCELWFCKL